MGANCIAHAQEQEQEFFPETPCNAVAEQAAPFASTIPSLIDVEISRSQIKKWIENQIRAMNDDTRNIIDKRKKKFSGTVRWQTGDTVCESSADVRLTGDWRDHLGLDPRKSRPISSIAVRLHDQHINGITRFKLLLPGTRNGDMEIFTTLLFREFGFLAPQTYKLAARINGDQRTMLFQEVPAKEMFEAHGLRESLTLEGDERGMWRLVEEKPELDKNWHEQSGIGLPDNASWISGPVPERIALRALSHYSRLYANHLDGLSFGKIGMSDFVPEAQLLVANDWIRDESLFVLLSRFLNASHGLRPHNRKFYFDPIYEQFRPIYYDGNAAPMAGKFQLDVRNFRIGDFESADAVFSSAETRERIYRRFEASGGTAPRDNLETAITHFHDLNKQLIALRRDIPADQAVAPIPEFWDLSAHLERHRLSSQAFIGFNLDSNSYQRCIVRAPAATSCDDLPAAAAGEYFRDPQLPNGHFVPMIGYFRFDTKSRIQFLGEASRLHAIQNPQPGGTVVTAGETVWWHFDDTGEAGTFDIELDFDGVLAGKLIVSGNVPAGTVFDVSSDKAGALDFASRYDEHLLTSCLTLVDATLSGVVITSANAACEDGVNFLRANGDVAKLEVTGSAADAIDADFSALDFQSIEVNGAGNDCIDLSMGNYDVVRFSASNCGDKGVSVGEQARVTIKQISVESAVSGIAAKDSAILQIEEARVENVDYCMQAYRKKQEFDGALIVATNAIDEVCLADSRVQPGSELRVD